MDITTEVKDPFTLGQVIQQSRLQQGMSQRGLAQALGTNQKWVWEMEQGKPGILMDRLFKTFEATGITLYAKFDVKSRPEK
ncbi:MAG: helix-turn-helix domain-containing protein [Eggerthellaceae bacterium]|nr:helix-turn-helix domain-containing protein [Eggerthellaceae bacterium]